MALVKLTENQVARLARRIHIYQRTEAARECAQTIFGNEVAHLTIHCHYERGSWVPRAVTAYDRDLDEIAPSVDLMIQDGVKNLPENELRTRMQDWMCDVLIDLLLPFVYMAKHEFDLTIENKLPELWAPEEE